VCSAVLYDLETTTCSILLLLLLQIRLPSWPFTFPRPVGTWRRCAVKQMRQDSAWASAPNLPLSTHVSIFDRRTVTWRERDSPRGGRFVGRRDSTVVRESQVNIIPSGKSIASVSYLQKFSALSSCLQFQGEKLTFLFACSLAHSPSQKMIISLS
jgi:hypothetical protein